MEQRPRKSGTVWLTCYLLWEGLEKAPGSFTVFKATGEKRTYQVSKFRSYSVLQKNAHGLCNKMHLDLNPGSLTF